MLSLSPRSPRRRAASLCLCTAFALSLAGAAAPLALAASVEGGTSVEGGSAFNELAQGAQETTPTTTTTSTTATETTTNSDTVTVIALSLGAAALLIGGIAFAILRDARKVAPAGDVRLAEAGAARDSTQRLHKRRAKARAARQQRKRNR